MMILGSNTFMQHFSFGDNSYIVYWIDGDWRLVVWGFELVVIAKIMVLVAITFMWFWFIYEICSTWDEFWKYTITILRFWLELLQNFGSDKLGISLFSPFIFSLFILLILALGIKLAVRRMGQCRFYVLRIDFLELTSGTNIEQSGNNKRNE